MFNSSFTRRFRDVALICQTDADELPSVTSQILTNVFGWGGQPHTARSSRVKTRFARHQRLSTCSADPLTSKQRQVATWGEVRPSVEPVSDSEFALTVMLPWGNVPRAAGRQLLSFLFLRVPEYAALPRHSVEKGNDNVGEFSWGFYISLQDLNEKNPTTLKLTASLCLL